MKKHYKKFKLALQKGNYDEAITVFADLPNVLVKYTLLEKKFLAAAFKNAIHDNQSKLAIEMLANASVRVAIMPLIENDLMLAFMTFLKKGDSQNISALLKYEAVAKIMLFKHIEAIALSESQLPAFTLLKSESIQKIAHARDNEFLETAIRENKVGVALKLLSLENVKKQCEESQSMHYLIATAADKEMPDVALKLLDVKQIHTPAAINARHMALRSACLTNQPEVALKLIQVDKHIFDFGHKDYLRFAIQNEMTEVAMELLQHPNIRSIADKVGAGQGLLQLACRNNMPEVALELLKIPGIKEISHDQHPNLGTESSNIARLKMENASDKMISTQLNYALKQAKRHGMGPVEKKLERLLEESKKRVEMRTINLQKLSEISKKRTSLKFAVQLKREQILEGIEVNHVTPDLKAEASVLRQQSKQAATSFRAHLANDMVASQLSEPDLAHINNNKLLNEAIDQKDTDLALKLLSLENVKNQCEDSQSVHDLIGYATYRDMPDVAFKLLDFKQMRTPDAIHKRHFALREACMRNQSDLALKLIKTDKDTFDFGHKDYLIFSIKNGMTEVVRDLLQHPNMRQVAKRLGGKQGWLKYACYHNMPDIAVELLKVDTISSMDSKQAFEEISIFRHTQQHHMNGVEEVLADLLDIQKI